MRSCYINPRTIRLLLKSHLLADQYLELIHCPVGTDWVKLEALSKAVQVHFLVCIDDGDRVERLAIVLGNVREHSSVHPIDF